MGIISLKETMVAMVPGRGRSEIPMKSQFSTDGGTGGATALATCGIMNGGCLEGNINYVFHVCLEGKSKFEFEHVSWIREFRIRLKPGPRGHFLCIGHESSSFTVCSRSARVRCTATHSADRSKMKKQVNTHRFPAQSS